MSNKNQDQINACTWCMHIFKLIKNVDYKANYLDILGAIKPRGENVDIQNWFKMSIGL